MGIEAQIEQRKKEAMRRDIPKKVGFVLGTLNENNRRGEKSDKYSVEGLVLSAEYKVVLQWGSLWSTQCAEYHGWTVFENRYSYNDQGTSQYDHIDGYIPGTWEEILDREYRRARTIANQREAAQKGGELAKMMVEAAERWGL